MSQSIKLALPLAALTLLLAACTPPAATPTAAFEPTDAGGGPGDPGYPSPHETYEPPYPIESSDQELFEQSITPISPTPFFTADTGAMTITLVYPDGARPVRGQLFFAASTLEVPDMEDAFIPALDPLVDKKGHSDGSGVLVISEIPPGRYVLALMTPLAPILVERADDMESIVFEIAANEVLDLGQVAVFLDAETLEP